MYKILILTLFYGIVSFSLSAQKYIKYIFLDNKVKITVPVKLEKKEPKDFQDREVLKLIKVWQTKKSDALMMAFQVPTTPNLSNCDMIQNYLKELSSFTENKSIRSSKTQLINNRQEICVMEISESGNNSDKEFMMIFGGKLNDSQTIIFTFQCPEQRKKHYQPVISGIIKSLTLN